MMEIRNAKRKRPYWWAKILNTVLVFLGIEMPFGTEWTLQTCEKSGRMPNFFFSLIENFYNVG
jgi:hypothetical protein